METYSKEELNKAIDSINNIFEFINNNKDSIESGVTKYSDIPKDIRDNYKNFGKILLQNIVGDAVEQIGISKDSLNLSSKFTFSRTSTRTDAGGSVPIQTYAWCGDIVNNDDFTVGVMAYLNGGESEDRFIFHVYIDVRNSKYEKLDKTKYEEKYEGFKETLLGLKEIIKNKKNEHLYLKNLYMKLDIKSNKKGDGIVEGICLPSFEISLKDKKYEDIISEVKYALIMSQYFFNYLISDDEEKEEKVKDILRVADMLQCALDNELPIGKLSLTIMDYVFNGCKQLVLTGAPGTGKTYSAKEFVDWQIVTEAIRDNVIDNDKNKTLKELKNELINKLESESDVNKDKKEKYLNRYKMVQFHPSYDYTDFVEGLRPVKLNGKTQFVRMDGEFKKFCRIAAGDTDNNYYFIIDEINRADLSKVFGELMYCLEEGYRGENNKISTQYNNLPTYEVLEDKSNDSNVKIIENDIYREKFYIPENVIIIATMNDIDRSVDTFDFALRRRFKWIDVIVDDALLQSTFDGMKKNFKSNTSAGEYVNRIIKMNEVFDEYSYIFKTPGSYKVGPSYFEGIFKTNDPEKALVSIWNDKVQPLLREYVRGRQEANDFVGRCGNALEVSSGNGVKNGGDNSEENIIVRKIDKLIQDGCKQLVLTGAPGTGKTYAVKEYVKKEVNGDETRFSMVQFHPSYDYTDFVEGLRPAKIKKKDGDETSDTTSFVRMDGEFKKFCRLAAKPENKDNKYYFIIDEINRADLSKVFGELMYCLEEGYRGKENSIATQYNNLPTYYSDNSNNLYVESYEDTDEEDIYEDEFYIPGNVIIIGTMNDIDRSVDTFDFALRRRFRWVDINVDKTLLESAFKGMEKKNNGGYDKASKYIDNICKMNEVFEKEEYQRIFKPADSYKVGPAYFEGLFKGDDINSIWSSKVEPLLREYVRGRDDAENFILDCKNALIGGSNGDKSYRSLKKIIKDIFSLKQAPRDNAIDYFFKDSKDYNAVVDKIKNKYESEGKKANGDIYNNEKLKEVIEQKLSRQNGNVDESGLSSDQNILEGEQI